jgi:hypothetical protein
VDARGSQAPGVGALGRGSERSLVGLQQTDSVLTQLNCRAFRVQNLGPDLFKFVKIKVV